MYANDQEKDLTLDELIGIVNCPAISRTPDVLQPKENKANHAVTVAKEALSQKWMQFKPWSGHQNQETEPIKEEIEGNEHSSGQETETEPKIYAVPEDQHEGYLYRFQNGPIKLIKKLLDENGFSWSTSKSWTIYWSSTVIKPEVYQELLPYQKINHFPNSFHLTRKDLMNKCISKMQIKYGMNHFSFLPKTYILPQEYSLLQEDAAKGGHTYIVKPHNRSQGKGITVTSSMQVVAAKLEKYSSVVVSHYVDSPLLINGLKFDLRIYVAITSVNPLRVYVYKQGLARFATESYDQTGADSEHKKYQHLTNYSINKKNSDFVKSQAENEEYFGSKWRLTALKDFLEFNIGRNEAGELFERIDEVIVKTIISGENILYTNFMANVPYIDGCFQVLGFDVLIDSNLKPWLVEVNMSPSMNSDSILDIKIKGNMIADLLTLAGIVPLTQRYSDEAVHLKQQSKNYYKSDNQQISIGAIERHVLREVKAENERTGGWKRVFPAQDPKRYKSFFEADRYFNRLLREDDTSSEKMYLLPNNKVAVVHKRVDYSREYSREKKDREYRSIKQIRSKAQQVSHYTSLISSKEKQKEQQQQQQLATSSNPKKFTIRIQKVKQKRVYL